MTLEDVIADHTEEIQDIFHRLRTIVLNTNPKPDESFIEIGRASCRERV